jgi:hypothetical protein
VGVSIGHRPTLLLSPGVTPLSLPRPKPRTLLVRCANANESRTRILTRNSALPVEYVPIDDSSGPAPEPSKPVGLI